MTCTVYVLSNGPDIESWRVHAPEGVDLVAVDLSQTLEEQAACIKGAVAVISPVTADVVGLARLVPSLKLVQVGSAGTDRIDVKALGEMSVQVANGGGGNAVAVSEHAVALMLTVYRKLDIQFSSVAAGRWGDDLKKWSSSTRELTRKTVGIVGLGRIGQEVAKRLRGFDCKLYYSDMAPRASDLERALGVTRLELDELLADSDVVTLHVPLTVHTRRLIGARELDLMKPTAFLINVSRGPVVDEAALIEGLRAGKIAGAGLDVLEQEPTDPDNPLLQMENVAVTPHLASFAQEAVERSFGFAVHNAARVVDGEEPMSVVLPELGGPDLQQ